MKISIIGAGLTGLSAALDLVKSGHQVIVYESQQSVGGLASGFKLPQWDWSVENYYHHWFSSDKSIRKLLEELELENNLIFKKPKTVIYHQGDFYPLDSIPAILKFPGLNTGQTLRFGAVTAHVKYLAKWQDLEKVTAHSWLKKHYGQDIYSTTWQPMLEGKFGPHYKEANMAWMWARLKARTPQLGTYQGGFQAFLDDFYRLLKEKGVVFKLNTAVSNITHSGSKIKVSTKKDSANFDKCLVTTSPQLFSSLAPSLPPKYLEKITKLKSMGAVVVVFSLKNSLSEKGYYWYNLPKQEKFPFLALVEHTNFISPSHFDGDHIVYCGDYRDPSHSYFKLSPANLINKFYPALSRINPRFEPSWIKNTWVFRTPYAQPVPLINHSQVIPPIQTPISGLFYTSMSHIYPWDRGTNYAVKWGRQTALLMQQSE